MKGKLYLIPLPIAEGTLGTIPPATIDAIRPLRYFLAEEIRTARRFLSSLKIFPSIEELHFEQLNKDTRHEELKRLLQPLLAGHDLGVMSEAGCPGVADPGGLAVQHAHALGIDVIPLVGPSSILMALMASGLNGQQFAFHGYLPIDEKEIASKIKELERESRNRKQTQLFIETPYRNNAVFQHLLKNLSATTMLSVAIDLSGQVQRILTFSIEQWKTRREEWPKAPAVFSFLA